MINIGLLDAESINEIEKFSAITQAHNKMNKNGNSLRMELELKMFNISDIQTFQNKYNYISDRIEEILRNIKVKKI